MDWKAMLIQQGLLIADGAWGTELAKKGLKPGECPEAWNLDRPREVRGVAAAYVEAGAQIVLTNTFGATRLKLARCGLGDRTKEINQVGARLSREAAEDRALVFASVGPTGELMEPLGSAPESVVVETYIEQIRALIEGGAQGLVIETFIDLAEAQCALKAARGLTDLPVAVSMSFEEGRAGFATVMGITPERAASELEAAGADMVGSNCGSGIERMVRVAGLMRPETARPLWIKSNAGTPHLVGGKTVFGDPPRHMADQVPALVEAGANIIGGCCGTTPEHIRAIAAAAAEGADPARANLKSLRFRT